MKVHNGMHYMAMHKNGNGWLCTNPEQEKSIDGIKEAIDESNKIAVERGFNAIAYVIAVREIRTIWDDTEEDLIQQTITTTALEKYPAELKAW